MSHTHAHAEHLYGRLNDLRLDIEFMLPNIGAGETDAFEKLLFKVEQANDEIRGIADRLANITSSEIE